MRTFKTATAVVLAVVLLPVALLGIEEAWHIIDFEIHPLKDELAAVTRGWDSDSAAGKKVLLGHVPLGTPAAIVFQTLRSEGFGCDRQNTREASGHVLCEASSKQSMGEIIWTISFTFNDSAKLADARIAVRTVGL